VQVALRTARDIISSTPPSRSELESLRSIVLLCGRSSNLAVRTAVKETEDTINNYLDDNDNDVMKEVVSHLTNEGMNFTTTS